jgi:hypothetical protein
MNFNFGEVLTRAWQITWKHKSLWVIMLISVIVLLFFLPAAVPLFFVDEEYGGIAIVLSILLFIIAYFMSLAFGAITSSAATLGVMRAEHREGSLRVTDLLRDTLPHFRPLFSAILIINLTVGMVFSLFFLLFFVLTIVTMGIASICLQPVMILISPLSFLLVAVIENTQAAILAQGLGAVSAIKFAFQLVRKNLWSYILITLVIYFGSSILSSFIIVPVMIPFMGLGFVFASPDTMNPETIGLVALLFTCIFIPVMMLYQALVGTFMKSSLVLAYLRLTDKQPDENEIVYAL